MKILIAQMNPTIGDLTGNTQLIIQNIQSGVQQNADVVLFPELALTGYPPEDILLFSHFMENVSTQLNLIVEASKGITTVVGVPRTNPKTVGKSLFNSAAIIQDQKLIGFQDKILLPTYDVYDEARYFEPGEYKGTWNIAGKKVAISICEDIWQYCGDNLSNPYLRDPVQELVKDVPDIMLNLSASPYSFNKFSDRIEVCERVAATLNCPVVYCNQIGAHDSLIFDGYSLYITPEGLKQCARGFAPDALLIDSNKNYPNLKIERNNIEDLYQALILGVKDYFGKLGFTKACLGLSGGIDSALVACIAAEALGSKNVLALIMPSRYSAPESKRDAIKLAEKLGIEYKELSIESPFETYLNLLDPYFQGKKVDHTEENLQARIRGMLLMAFSNKFGYIVLSTGNKSELAVGYSTLYGDMCGGLGVINDVTKQQVYALANWINRNEEIIPTTTIQRAPTAELRENQKDSDTLPDYEVLDNVLCAYVVDHLSTKKIVDQFNYPQDLVEKIIKLIHQNEYKRRQAPPGLRVSEKAFSAGRRFPIVQKWK